MDSRYRWQLDQRAEPPALPSGRNRARCPWLGNGRRASGRRDRDSGQGGRRPDGPHRGAERGGQAARRDHQGPATAEVRLMPPKALPVELYYDGAGQNTPADEDVFTAPITIKRGQSDEATQ